MPSSGNFMLKLKLMFPYRRLFNYLEVIRENNHKNGLDLELILECIQKGSSDFAFTKMVSERKLHGQGGTIKTRADKYSTGDLFDKPVNINDVTCEDDIDQYLYPKRFRKSNSQGSRPKKTESPAKALAAYSARQKTAVATVLIQAL